MKNLKNTKEKGITLIALVVTITVLIILATVSVNTVLGDNGIIKRAQKASLQKIKVCRLCFRICIYCIYMLFY